MHTTHSSHARTSTLIGLPLPAVAAALVPTASARTAALYAAVIEAQRELRIVERSTYSSQAIYERDHRAARLVLRARTVDWLEAHGF